MAEIRIMSLLALIILLSTVTHCSHQTRSTETARVSSGQSKDLGFQASPQKGIILEPPTTSIDKDVTTESIYNCGGYRSDAKSITNYQVLVFGSWVSRKCHFNLIWNQKKCQCDWKPGIIMDLEESTEDKCDLSLNITFRGDIVRDYAKNTFIEVDSLIGIEPDSVADRSGVNSGHFAPGRLTVHFFAGNSYSDMFQLRIDFKQDEKALHSSQEVTLITNTCEITYNVSKPTIAVRINSTRQELSFVVNGHVETAKLNTKTHQWHKLEVSFVKGAVNITDNDQLIFTSTAYPAFVEISQCPLSIGGDPTDTAKSFHGYIKSILLWRHCPSKSERNLPIH